MKYLIVTELCEDGDCCNYLPDNANVVTADDFHEAKRLFAKKIAHGLSTKADYIFDDEQKVIPITNSIKCFDEEYDAYDEDDEDYDCDDEMGVHQALLEIEKVIMMGKYGNIFDYKCQEVSCNYNDFCTVAQYMPCRIEYCEDCENGMARFRLNAHNMIDESKTYYFEFKDWYNESSFRVVMYPLDV